ncbi:luciferin 4-monooxygenase-like [Ornithodoros turicata]|uniref:luciferin 4-monooxygenase-like n=1 Tax=Ornithodoros turicata TaxID=34597 RepID=UPI003139C63F
MEMKARIENGVVYSPYPDVSVPDISLYACIKRYIQKHGDNVAAIEGDRQWTFNDILRCIERYAAGYQSIGIAKGDRVCVYLVNSFESLLAVYGIIAAGGVLITAKPSLTHRELLYQLSDSDSTYILTDKENAGKVTEAKDQHKLKALLCMDALPGFKWVQQFKDLPESSFKDVPIENPKEELVGIVYTSGTSGLPKGVLITHYGWVTCIVETIYSYPFTEEKTMISWSPISHASGILSNLVCFTCGVTCVMVDTAITVGQFVETVNKHKVESAYFFPTRLQAFVNVMEAAGYKTPSIKSIIVGGSVISPSVAQKVLKVFNLECFKNLYGLTEACGLICATPAHTICYENVGFPASMVQVKIVDVVTKKTLGPGKKGELVAKMPNIMKGYYKKPEATAEVLVDDGWLRTGDYAYYDENGRFCIVDRLKEMIKCLDQQVCPAEIEELLLSHPAVDQATVVGIPNPQYGEAPTAFVVLKPSVQGTKELKGQLNELINRETAIHKHLYGGINFVDRLPMTESGKVRRSILCHLHSKKSTE